MKCLIQKPQDRDISHYLQSNSNVSWSTEALSFLGNIQDQRIVAKVKEHVDNYMMLRPAPRQVYANHIFGAKPPIQMIYPPFADR